MFLWLACVATYVLTAIGCSEPEPITKYRIPTQIPAQLLPGKDRMLAAMVPHGGDVWFFKVTGPEDSIKEIQETFRDFVINVQFVDSSPDLSNPPKGWKRGRERQMRFASFDVTTKDKQLDVSISMLPGRDDWDDYVSENVNRWRGQLGLEPSTERWAAAETIEVPAADGDSIWLDITGKPGGGSSMMPPMMASQNQSRPIPPQASAPEVAPQSPAGEMTADRDNLKFERPDSWRDGRPSSMRWASFAAGPTDAEAEISMMPAGGNLRDNVARWLEQVRLTKPPEDVVDQAMAAAEKRTVSDRDAQRFILTGENAQEGEIIDATIVPVGAGFSMFIKMKGPAATVSSQREAMGQFLDSLKF
ncbi:hypothetical protein Pla52nx_005482 [Stieleria varia]